MRRDPNEKMAIYSTGADDDASDAGRLAASAELAEIAMVELTDEQLQEKLNTTLYVGCSVRMFSNPYMVTINDGCELFCEYLDSIGQKYEYEVMLNEGSNDTQINQISAFLAKAQRKRHPLLRPQRGGRVRDHRRDGDRRRGLHVHHLEQARRYRRVGIRRLGGPPFSR